jgi:hypothetical protein
VLLDAAPFLQDRGLDPRPRTVMRRVHQLRGLCGRRIAKLAAGHVLVLVQAGQQ